MSERYNVSASDVLGENYKITSVECSDYNPSIDSNITVTITVNDVYGDAVSGESVTVTASEGNFTQLNGSDITSASSVTGTTNSSGEFTLTYACSVWGLITFTANNKTTQANVTRWKQVQSLASDRVIVYTDGKNAKIKIAGTFIFSTTAGEYNLGTLDSAYQPAENYSVNYSYGVTNYAPVYVKSDDLVIHLYKNASSSSNVTCNCTLFYPLKTPLY